LLRCVPLPFAVGVRFPLSPVAVPPLLRERVLTAINAASMSMCACVCVCMQPGDDTAGHVPSDVAPDFKSSDGAGESKAGEGDGDPSKPADEMLKAASQRPYHAESGAGWLAFCTPRDADSSGFVSVRGDMCHVSSSLVLRHAHTHSAHVVPTTLDVCVCVCG
jgi:hypothetical protein